ncbi:hypothetical protein FL857_11625 [Criibacterium bergeronii]|uniref:Uncharacterized protein n=1 Tax=Criibacterium bergeronii TaxID=1871336 RepID=A0A552UVN0_9FIRM|nr:hypothetical protein [Criibacterium bergeronii]TRW22255.1 hypothetical protein FL857_11625 [Criibacterium bergeronii]
MKKLTDLFANLRRLNLKSDEIQDSLYRISNWLSDEDHKETDEYVQNQLEFLFTLVKKAEEHNKIYLTVQEARDYGELR